MRVVECMDLCYYTNMVVFLLTEVLAFQPLVLHFFSVIVSYI